MASDIGKAPILKFFLLELEKPLLKPLNFLLLRVKTNLTKNTLI